MKQFLLGLVFSLCVSAALAQGCGPTNPNCVVPLRPLGDNTNAAASTAFVSQGMIINPVTGLSTGLIVNTNSSGTSSANPAEVNQFNCVTDSVNSTNAFECVGIYHGFGGGTTQAARQALLVTSQQLAATSASNPNRNYVAGTFFNTPLSNDGGGVGTEKGQYFGINPIVSLCATCSNTASAIGGEVDISLPVGSSTLDKYGWLITQLSTDKVSGSRNNAGLAFTAQAGAVGWDILWQVGDGLNQAPLKSTGTLLAFKGSPTVANVIDASGATVTGCAFKTSAACLDPVLTAWAAYTPSPSCGTATFTINSARFKTMGKTTFVNGDFTIATIGSCAAPNITFTLPSTPQVNGAFAYRDQNTSLVGSIVVLSGSTTATATTFNGSPNFAVNTRLIFDGVYENQ